MEIFVWLEVMPDQVELKCAIITHGGQCVMILGVSRMLEWYADNLDYHQNVSISTKSPKFMTLFLSVFVLNEGKICIPGSHKMKGVSHNLRVLCN